MYFGNLSDFFYKGKTWLINQPRITKDKTFQMIKIGGKIFKLNVYTGVLYEINKNNNQIIIEKAKTNNIKNNIKIKKSNTNIKLYIKNKKEKKIYSSTEKNISNKSSDKKLEKNINTERNKNSNINNNFSLLSKNVYKNKNDKTFNLYLTNKYKLINNQKCKNINNIEKYSFKTYATNNKKRLRSKSYNYPILNIKKTIDFDNNFDNIFIQDDICEIKKDDNRLITKVKNQIFKDKMFTILQKKYNFYGEKKNPLLNIPKLKLNDAQKIYIDNKNTIIKKLFFNKNKTFRNKSKTLFENKTCY